MGPIPVAELLEDRFEIPASFDLADWWVQSTAQFKAALPVYPGRILVRNEVLERFRRESYAQIKATQSADSGWVAVEVHFHTEDSARGLLLGYGAAVKVLAPDKLMLSLTGEAKALLALYTGPDSAPQDHGQMKV